jgi:hypothetical protein
MSVTTLYYEVPAYVWPWDAAVSYGTLGGDLSPNITQQGAVLKVEASRGYDVTVSEYDPFAQHYRQLWALPSNRSLWSADAEPPSEESVAWAQAVMQKLEIDALVPTRVVASAEGGVAICFVDGDNYSDIEILNSGQLLGVTTDRVNRPVVWEIQPDARDIARATATIRAFISKTGQDATERPGSRYLLSSFSQIVSTL